MVGTLLSAGLLWWAFRSVDSPAVWSALKEISPWAVLASSLVICLSIPLRAQQWRCLLDGAPEVTAGRSIRAICLGNLINSAVPARAGELAKAWLLSRWSGLPVARVLTSLVIARVLDLGYILVLLGLVFAFVPIADGISVAAGAVQDSPLSIPRDSLNTAMGLFAAAAMTSAVLLILLSLNRARFGGWVGAALGRLSPGAARAWEMLWRPVEQGLGVVRSGRLFWGAVGLNLACWVVFVLTPFPMLLAMGLEPSSALIAMLGIVGLTTLAQLVPAAPTSLGTFHVTCLLALAVCCPEMERERALAFTLLLHPVDTLAAAIPGLFLVPGAWGDLMQARRERASGKLKGP